MDKRVTYDQAIEKVKHDPESRFIGYFMRGNNFLGSYEISLTDDEPEEPAEPSIMYEGGVFFSSSGEEEFYLEDEVPDEAKGLPFSEVGSIPDTSGYVAEHVAYSLFPDIPDPESIWGQASKTDFINRVREKMKEHWTLID